MALNKMPMTSDRPLYDEFYDGYRVFVGDLSEGVHTWDVEREFVRYGDLIDVWVARNPPGFGFVVFKNKVDCERCRRKLNGKSVFDRPIRIEYAQPFPIRDDGRAPASYQAYIQKMRERGLEPRYFLKQQSRTQPRRYFAQSQSPPPYYVARHQSRPRQYIRNDRHVDHVEDLSRRIVPAAPRQRREYSRSRRSEGSDFEEEIHVRRQEGHEMERAPQYHGGRVRHYSQIGSRKRYVEAVPSKRHRGHIPASEEEESDEEPRRTEIRSPSPIASPPPPTQRRQQEPVVQSTNKANSSSESESETESESSEDSTDSDSDTDSE